MLPNDPIMLLSAVNMKLRDFYKSLDEMCADLCVDRGEIEKKLNGAGFKYDENENRFV